MSSTTFSPLIYFFITLDSKSGGKIFRYVVMFSISYYLHVQIVDFDKNQLKRYINLTTEIFLKTDQTKKMN